MRLVNDIYECYEQINLALNMPFPEYVHFIFKSRHKLIFFFYRGSSLAATELKEKVRYASIALIKEKITHSFIDARNIYYTNGYKTIEYLFRSHLAQEEGKDRLRFAYLFSSTVSKYEGEDLEYQVQSILDSNLPGLVDVFNLSDDMLKQACIESFCNDEQNEIDVSRWLIPDNSFRPSVEEHEENRKLFSQVCGKLNVLSLTPNWINILKETIKKRLDTLAWRDNWSDSIVSVQLKWLHVLILPWLSYVIPSTGDTGKNNVKLIDLK